jgi:hypothetical protein
MDSLIFSISFTLAAVVIFSVLAAWDRKVTFAFALLAAIYVGLDDLVTGLPRAISMLSIPGTKWNWSGKILSLLLSALVIALLRISPAAVGLTLRQRHAKIGAVAVALFVIWGAAWGFSSNPGTPIWRRFYFRQACRVWRKSLCTVAFALQFCWVSSAGGHPFRKCPGP